jgi:PAS domain S-box-containing protein
MMDLSSRSPFSRYGTAVVLAVVGALLRIGLTPFIGPGVRFITIFPVVAISALFGGVWSGVVTTVLGALFVDLFTVGVEGLFSFEQSTDITQTILFVLMGCFISWVAGERQRARVRLRRVETEAERHAREASEALRESEERSELAQSSVGVGVWEWDLTNDAITWSEGMYRLIGVNPGEDTEKLKTWESLILPEDREIASGSIKKLIDEGSPNFYGEFRISRKDDGKVRWLATQGKIIREGEQAVRLLGVNFDITETKESELKIQRLNRELNRRLRELQTIIELTPVGISVAQDASCDTITANPALAEMVGVESGDNISSNRHKLPYRHLRDGRELAPSELPMQRAVREKRPIDSEEMDIERADGNMVTVVCYAAPIIDDEGEVLGCVAAQIDISERKKFERDRELKLTEEQTLRRQAEEANRLKDEFLATVSHELRTPLNSIIGWITVLHDGRLTEDLRVKAVDAIERGARSQVQLIEDLLDVSRIISGKLQINPQPIELREVVLAAVDTVRPAAEAKNIRLDFHINGPSGSVMGDFERLQQIVWNLLSNAIKFTPSYGDVDVKLQQSDGHLDLTVRDTGKGIGRDFLPYVFDRFRQADGSITRAASGLGLGLSIVKHLVELHGGSVSVASEGENKGASFTVKLPAAPHAAAGSNGHRPGHSRLPSIKDLRVLVVDDEPDTREVMKLAFENCEASVETAASVTEALSKVKAWRPQVIVSDIGMPGEDGYSLMRQVREWESTHDRSRTPSIALTAYTRIEDRDKALGSGYDKFLAKPVGPEDVIAAVDDLVSDLKSA